MLVILQETIRNDDFKYKTALHHCCDIVSNGCNIVPILQRCVAPLNRLCESFRVHDERDLKQSLFQREFILVARPV